MRKGSRHSESALQKMRHPRGPLRDPMQRFEEKVDRHGPIVRPELGPCHLWTAKCRKGRFNYGQFFYKGRYVEAHRWIFERVCGPLSGRQCALHRCDNPPCVNEDHLFAGTRRDNCLDMLKKGRHRPGRGERQHGAKLSYQEASTIKWMLEVCGASHRYPHLGETGAAGRGFVGPSGWYPSPTDSRRNSRPGHRPESRKPATRRSAAIPTADQGSGRKAASWSAARNAARYRAATIPERAPTQTTLENISFGFHFDILPPPVYLLGLGLPLSCATPLVKLKD